MPAKTELKDHFTKEELEERYRKEKNVILRSRWHIIWLRSKGFSTREISDVTGCHPNMIRYTIHKYNEIGADAMIDHRSTACGAAPLLNDAQLHELDLILASPQPDGSPWTGPAVAKRMAQMLQIDFVYPQRGWDYMKKLGYSCQTPRPAHTKRADEDQKREWKKKSGRAHRRVSPTVP